MRRLTEKEKATIKILSKTHSLKEIAVKMKLPKTVVYYWTVKILGKKTRPVKINSDLKSEAGEIVGAFAGDGNFYIDRKYAYKIRISLSKDEFWYAEKLNKMFELVYNRKGYISKAKTFNVLTIFGKEIIADIRKYLYWKGKKTYSVRLRDVIELYDPEFIIGFCRGLFNTDGWMTKKNMGFGSTSYGLFMNFLEILNLYDIEYSPRSYDKKGRHKFYLVAILKKSREKFLKTFKIKEVLPTGISGI